MKSPSEYEAVLRLSSLGSTDGVVARILGIPRETVRDWRRSATAGKRHRTKPDEACPVCCPGGPFDKAVYAYLLGMYLGDGCLSEHRVGRGVYPRYLFSNRSTDILRIFCRACEAFGLSWTQPSFKHISVARARDVARLDAIIGPKH